MKKLFYTLCILGVASFVLAIAILLHAKGLFDTKSQLQQDQFLTIAKGSNLKSLSKQLGDEGLVLTEKDRFIFEIAMRAYQKAGNIQAGEFRIPARSTMRDIMFIVTEGQEHLHNVTIPEGLTVKQIYEELRKNEILTGDITIKAKEGTLFPETYRMPRGTSRDTVIRHMQRTMTKHMELAWEGRSEDTVVRTPAQAIILASIVEKETGLSGERGMVAGVFTNRLRKGMMLQSDPTVIYAVTDGYGKMPRPIYKKDLKSPSPYNTYRHVGLTPTAIANPGAEAIKAVLHPTKHKFLYFVADGTGGHRFATNLTAHNMNVQHWRRVEKQQKIEKKKRQEASKFKVTIEQ